MRSRVEIWPRRYPARTRWAATPGCPGNPGGDHHAGRAPALAPGPRL